AEYWNKLNLAVNTLENTMTAKADAGDLADVATSGAYTDLIGTPFIPTEPADIDAQPAGDYVTADELTTALAGKADVDDIPDEVPIANIAAAGTPTSATFLRGDGTWSPPPPDISGGINGAAGDGVTDDTDAINAALLAA